MAHSRLTFLFLALAGVSLILSACTGGVEQAATATIAAPTVSKDVTSTPKDTPTTPVETSTTLTEPSTSSEGAPAAPEITSTTGPTATAQAYPTRKPASAYEDLEVITLLPRDAIPAIDNPQFLSADEADEFYDPDELVMGVSFNGDSRAYSAPFLSNHEIVNDTVGGVKIAVTW